MIDTLALIVDLDALEHNIATMVARAKAWGVALRPHAKTHKCSAIARRQVEAGTIGIACATIDEAEVMVEADLPGVLVTSPLATEHKVRRFTELLHRRPDLAVVADHPQHVVLLAEMALRYSVAPSVLVDLDVGDHRTGTETLEAEIGADLIVLKTQDRFARSPVVYTRALSRANGFFRGNRFEFEARRFRKEKEHYERHHQPEHREIPNREPMRSGRTIEQALKKEAQGAASRSCNR